MARGAVVRIFACRHQALGWLVAQQKTARLNCYIQAGQSKPRHFWLRDKSLEDSDDLPEPEVLAQEIADDLQTALEQFQAIAEKVNNR